jgi:hypothetical protein
MDLNELENLKNLSELDLLYKIIEVAEGAKKRTELVLHNNHAAGVDVRKTLQDIRLLSLIMRDQIQRRDRKRKNKALSDESAIDKAIQAEILRLKKEDARIKKLEEKRKRR